MTSRPIVIRSPALRNMSISRGAAGRAVTSGQADQLVGGLPMGDHDHDLGALRAACVPGGRPPARMRSASPTEGPPNFWTMRTRGRRLRVGGGSTRSSLFIGLEPPTSRRPSGTPGRVWSRAVPIEESPTGLAREARLAAEVGDRSDVSGSERQSSAPRTVVVVVGIVYLVLAATPRVVDHEDHGEHDDHHCRAGKVRTPSLKPRRTRRRSRRAARSAPGAR